MGIKNSEQIEKIIELLESRTQTPDVWHKTVKRYPKDDASLFTKHEVSEYIKDHELNVSAKVSNVLRMKPRRTLSGIAPVTIFTKPYACSGNCLYCPSVENMPKSYLPNEPAMQRAIQQEFDPFKQVSRRLESFKLNGHNTSKIEIIISGGTWDDYPYDYRLWFICEVFRALNGDVEADYSASDEKLAELQTVNSKSFNRCIGMSVETRPDRVSFESIMNLRKMGITKVQIGVQSMDDEVLKLNCRGHGTDMTRKTIDLLRNNGFKVQIHWMCNLYGSNPENDYKDFIKLFEDQSVLPDEIKIYPCSIVEGTALHRLFNQGKYKPYSTDTLIELLAKCKTEIKPYCRVSRLFRDIPSDSIVEGNKKTNLREMVQKFMKSKEMKCNCIRCNEIMSEVVDAKALQLDVLEYASSVSNEYFVTYRDSNNRIAAFLRLAIYKPEVDLPRLIAVDAMIREIHVYGRVVNVGLKTEGASQHVGLGTLLIQKAEEIAKQNDKTNLGVISAVGTREYYAKRGFTIEPDFGYGIKQL